MKNYASQKFVEIVADGKMNAENPVGTGSLIMNGKSRDVGVNSVSIGNNTIAKANYSYAEGNNTIASSSAQHVQGKFNIEDLDGKYAHIVGNGTSNTARSNAHTLDWNGVGWFKGDLQVGGNSQDDGARSVLLNGDALRVESQTYEGLPDNSVNWRSIEYGDGKFVAISANSNIAAYSYDGIDWFQTVMPAEVNWKKVVYGNGKFVAVSGYEEASNIASYSEDGMLWVQTAMPSIANWSSVAYGNGRFVAVSGGVSSSAVAAYSEDGINWHEVSMPKALYWRDIVYSNGLFVTIGFQSSNRYIAYSENGIDWSKAMEASLGSGSLFDMATNHDGIFISNVLSYNEILKVTYNKAANSWSMARYDLPYSCEWRPVAYGNNKFITIGYNSNKAAYSQDGTDWIGTTMPIVAKWRDVIYANGKFIAISQESNAIAYSEDGIVWKLISYNILTQDNKNVTNDVKNAILNGKDPVLAPAILMKDEANGYTYCIRMHNGILTSTCKATGIKITTLPNKIEYSEGEMFDPTGIVLTIFREDGTSEVVDNYFYQVSYNGKVQNVTFIYTEFGIKYITTLVDALLEDFNYINNGDGTYTITEWKETLNGSPSTEMIVPDSECFII